MVKIRAYIKLYENGRKTPFYSGYRPLFNFIDEMKTSGRIDLIDKDQFCPGEEGEVDIVFLSRNYLGSNFDIGKTFLFGEGGIPLGEGVIKEILHKHPGFQWMVFHYFRTSRSSHGRHPSFEQGRLVTSLFPLYEWMKWPKNTIL